MRDMGRGARNQLKDSFSNLSLKTRKNAMNDLRNFFSWSKDRETVRKIPVSPKIAGEDRQG